MHDESCSGCRFFLDFTGGHGECRRSPPKIVSVLLNGRVVDDAQGGRFVKTEDIYNASMMPIVSSCAWCGEWQPN